jgi:hypothetical protein
MTGIRLSLQKVHMKTNIELYNNEINIKNIYDGLNLDLHASTISEGSNEIVVLDQNYRSMSRLYRIEEFVKDISASHELGFIWIRNKNNNPQLKRLSLGRYLVEIDSFRSIYSSSIIYSEWVNAFYECFAKLGLEDEIFHSATSPSIIQNKLILDRFNDLIEAIRDVVNSCKFRQRIATRKQRSYRNFLSGALYIEKLLEKIKRLLVLRLDLYYEQEYQETLTVDDVKLHLKHLLSNRRSNNIFSSMEGYIWKIEYGHEGRGFHIHLMLFFNERERCKDSYICSEIGKYWINTIVSGKGSYFNCNYDKNRYRKLGIGKIHRSDSNKIDNLYEAMKYLTKSDQYFMFKRVAKTRVYGRGILPKKVPARANLGFDECISLKNEVDSLGNERGIHLS